MKELSIKQKAKAYDEALIKCSRLWESDIITRETYEFLFPELKEGEDEKIKKSLINYINAHGNGGDFTKEEYIAWVERQKQKPTDKVEPKFNIGDIIKPKDGGHEPWQIMQVDILDKKYRFKDGYVIHFSQEDNYELVKQNHKVTLKIYDSVPYEDDLSGVTHQQDGDSYIVEYEGMRAQGGTTPFNHLFVYVFPQEFTPPYPALAPWHWKDVGKFTGTDGKNAANAVDKVESKFKTGDWVVSPNGVYWHVDAIRDGRYQVSSNSGESADWPLDTNIYHRFTIEDAKDGDVLMSRAPFIYGKQRPYGGLDWYNGKFIKASNYMFKDSPVHPATKEQCDLLFQKMKEAGYEWDVEKKELKKFEPKFKVGDWIVLYSSEIEANRKVVQISRVERCQLNMYWTTEGTWFGDGTDARLWTIEDAKDGDVLSNGKMIVIFKHFEEPSYRQHIIAYIGLDTGGDIQITDGTWILGIDKTKPATKKQRNLLFQKMHEAGYTFDFEKKELKKLKFKVGDEVKTENEESLTITRIDEGAYWSNDLFICDFDSECLYDLVEQKPVIEMKTPEESLGVDSDTWNKIVDECVYGEQKPVKWKQENVEELSDFENAMMHIGVSFFGENAGLDPNDTASIKEQAELLLELAPKKDWSEEDESILQGIWDEILANKHDAKEYEWKTYDKFLNWLNSLKNRVQPQPRQDWSEEDETKLKTACALIRNTSLNGNEGVVDSTIDWLKSFKNRALPKPTWSEEDEHRVKDIIYFLDTAKKHYASTVELDSCIKWLKSLKKE